MFSSLTRLSHFELRARAYERHRRLIHTLWAGVTVDLSRVDIADAVAALPVLDAAAKLAGPLRLVTDDAGVHATLGPHFTAHRGPRTAAGPQLHLTLAPEPGAEARDRHFSADTPLRLRPLLTPDPDRQSAYLAWTYGAMAAGLPVEAAPPRLRLPLQQRRAARQWLRQRRLPSSPLVAVRQRTTNRALTDLLRAALDGLHRRIGTATLWLHEEPGAPAVGGLLGCALCISDDAAWANTAAALGVPAIVVQCPADPAAARGRHGLEPLQWGRRHQRELQVIRQRFRFAHDANPKNLVDLAEQLAAVRWPRDTLFRAGL